MTILKRRPLLTVAISALLMGAISCGETTGTTGNSAAVSSQTFAESCNGVAAPNTCGGEAVCDSSGKWAVLKYGEFVVEIDHEIFDEIDGEGTKRKQVPLERKNFFRVDHHDCTLHPLSMDEFWLVDDTTVAFTKPGLYVYENEFNPADDWYCNSLEQGCTVNYERTLFLVGPGSGCNQTVTHYRTNTQITDYLLGLFSRNAYVDVANVTAAHMNQINGIYQNYMLGCSDGGDNLDPKEEFWKCHMDPDQFYQFLEDSELVFSFLALNNVVCNALPAATTLLDLDDSLAVDSTEPHFLNGHEDECEFQSSARNGDKNSAMIGSLYGLEVFPSYCVQGQVFDRNTPYAIFDKANMYDMDGGTIAGGIYACDAQDNNGSTRCMGGFQMALGEHYQEFLGAFVLNAALRSEDPLLEDAEVKADDYVALGLGEGSWDLCFADTVIDQDDDGENFEPAVMDHTRFFAVENGSDDDDNIVVFVSPNQNEQSHLVWEDNTAKLVIQQDVKIQEIEAGGDVESHFEMGVVLVNKKTYWNLLEWATALIKGDVNDPFYTFGTTKPLSCWGDDYSYDCGKDVAKLVTHAMQKAMSTYNYFLGGNVLFREAGRAFIHSGHKNTLVNATCPSNPDVTEYRFSTDAHGSAFANLPSCDWEFDVVGTESDVDFTCTVP